MSTMLIIIIVLIVEYFYDDIKKFRQNEIILKSYHSFQNSLGKSDYVVNKIHLIFVAFVLLIGMIILTISSYISVLLHFVLSLFMLSYTLRTNQYNKDIEELKIKSQIASTEKTNISNEENSDIQEKNTLGKLVITEDAPELTVNESQSDQTEKNTEQKSNEEILSLSAEEQLQFALDQMMKKKYNNSKNVLEEIIINFPDNQLAGSAHFWLGKIYLFESNLLNAPELIESKLLNREELIVETFSFLKFSKVLLILFGIICIIFLCTTYDSTSYILSSASMKSTNIESTGSLRIIFAVLLVVQPTLLLFLGGVDSFKWIMVIFSVPLLLVYILLILFIVKNVHTIKKS